MLDADRIWRERGLRDAVLAGDETAWQTWYSETYAPLEAYIRWRCGNGRDLVEDVLQETWMIAIQDLRRFRPEAGSFQGWLRGIGANVIRNALRQRKRWEIHRQAHHREVSQCSSTDELERGPRIALALDGLPERYEMVLRAKYLEGRSVAAIAALWGETEKAIESLLSRARSAFKEAFLSQE
jgi:RNA polymerase sigma-70 factor (ECF subfamily)